MPGATILGLAGPHLGDAERGFFRDADPWGFILFARNVRDPDQLRRLTGALRDAVGRDAPVLIDQEGGRVARLRPPHWTGWPPALDQMARTRPGQGARAMWLRYRVIADELAQAGIDVNCAPVADLPVPGAHEVIGDRCYGGDPETVAAAGRAVAEGLLAGGVLPVLKHIPGHGRATADSHADLPRVATDRATLRRTDFAPFRALADLPLGMTAHVVFQAIDPEAPATLSPAVIGLIRDEIGFGGLLMTDDIGMGALSGPFEGRCRQALRAGCDVILHCSGDFAEMEQVAGAAGRLDGASLRRAEAALALRDRARQKAQRIDRAALLQEWAELLDTPAG